MEAQASVRRDEPSLPDDITGAELDRHVRGQLNTLAADNALTVARHLVAAGQLLDVDPERAYAHAMAAQQRAGRISVVREAAGFAAYHTGRYDEALRELRTVRRLTGSQHLLPVMADCERGRGRPERAVEMLESPEARMLDRAGQIELLLVVSGARRDLGEHDAAVLVLQVPELSKQVPPKMIDSQVRLQAAYADALEDAGREDEAATWRARALAGDVNGVLSEPGDDDVEDTEGFIDLEDLADEDTDGSRITGEGETR